MDQFVEFWVILLTWVLIKKCINGNHASEMLYIKVNHLSFFSLSQEFSVLFIFIVIIQDNVFSF